MTFLTNTSVLFQLCIWLWIQKFNSRKCWQKIESYLRQASEWPKRNQTMIKCHSWWISHIWHQASNPVFGHFGKLFFKKMGQPRPLFRLFSVVFSNKHQFNFYNKSKSKKFNSIQYTAPGFEPTTSRSWVISNNH